MKKLSSEIVGGGKFASIRKKIRAGRELLGMNQTQLAEYMGVSLSKISRAETGDIKGADTLLEIQSSLEAAGVRFSEYGVELVADRLETIEGKGCYVRLLDDVYRVVREHSNKDVLIMYASDRVSPPEVNLRYQTMLREGFRLLQLICEGDDYILGELEDYRTIPVKYFSNVVTVVYGDKVAQVNGKETRITIQNDVAVARRERHVFKYLWDMGKKPEKSNAIERL